MGARPAAIVLGGRGGDAARVPDPRTRLRADARTRRSRQNSAPDRRNGHRGGEGARRQEHARAVSVIVGLDHVVVLVRDIGKGAAGYEALLGCAPSWHNSGDGAERVLFTL